MDELILGQTWIFLAVIVGICFLAYWTGRFLALFREFLKWRRDHHV